MRGAAISDQPERPVDEGRTHSDLLLVPGADRKTAQEWALVLASQGLSSRTHVRDGAVLLEVPPGRIDAARATIDAYLRENPEVPALEPPPEFGAEEVGYAGLVFGVGILAVFASTGGWSASSELFESASANATQILAGQWWRCVTALCLHADVPHVLGNALIGGYLVTAVSRQLGSGFGIAAVLSSGALGNALNALAYESGHQSVGASTAVFGAIGILAGLAAARPSFSGRRRPRWLPFAAGLGLLAMLGTSGVRVDIWAHFFGLVAGCAIGAAAGWGVRVRPSWRIQLAVGSVATFVLIESWVLALTQAN